MLCRVVIQFKMVNEISSNIEALEGFIEASTLWNTWHKDGNHISENDLAGHDTCILCHEEFPPSNQVIVGVKGTPFIDTN